MSLTYNKNVTTHVTLYCEVEDYTIIIYKRIMRAKLNQALLN